MKYYYCNECKFTTKEYNKDCPICNNAMNKTKGIVINYDINIPKILKPDQRDIWVGYFCYKCRKMTMNNVCIKCNSVSLFAIKYQKKRAIINRIHHLNEVFSKQELDQIANQLTPQEKYWVYHNYEDAYRFFYKSDKMKASVCFFVAVIMYLVSLSVATNYAQSDTVIVSYIANGFANGILSLFMILGLGYVFDAASIEYGKTPAVIGVICGAFSLIYLVMAIILDWTFSQAFIFGFIFIGLSIIMFLIYYGLIKKIIEG